jgi:hypothetical protein
VLTETLLRAQERQARQGSDQPDLPQEVPADSSEPLNDGNRHHRTGVSPSYSDFEPFEVIDEEEEGKSLLPKC